MKSIITVILFTATLMLVSFRTNEAKLLTVSYSAEKWQSKINILEWTKNVLKNSDVPAKVVTAVSDSLTRFQTEMIQQLEVQIKPDSSKKK